MAFFARLKAIAIVLVMVPLSGCLFRSHPVQPVAITTPLKSASQQELITYVNQQAEKIQSMEATVDIDTSVGGEKKGKIIEYQQIRGYVIARKPAMLRMIGLMPIVRNRAFDMVSDGRNFKLWIPPKNRFVVGRNDVVKSNPQQPLENLRPQVVYDALLLRQIDENDIAVKENNIRILTDAKGRKIEQADYVIDIIQKGEKRWYISRKIVFSRATLLPSRQMAYDEGGELLTDVRYDLYKDYQGVQFPSRIAISRPQEEYDINLSFVKLELNTSITDAKFALEQPPGADVILLDHDKQDPPVSSSAGTK